MLSSIRYMILTIFQMILAIFQSLFVFTFFSSKFGRVGWFCLLNFLVELLSPSTFSQVIFPLIKEDENEK